MTRPLVLASASPARLRLLVQAGFDPIVIVSGVDETVADPSEPWDVVRGLAERKAAAVAERCGMPRALVVGCDSLFLFEGEAWGKPASTSDAVARWMRMRGKSGVLLTGHCVIDTATGAQAADVADTLVRFGHPSDAEIAAYVDSGEPLRVAGAFTLDGRSAPFVDGVDGDPGNVIGLSLPLLRKLVGQLDVDLTELWE